MIYYLYVKQHNETGLKYLGRTQRNPDTYKGSGIYWRKHLRKHGNNVSTYVLGTFDTLSELRDVGLDYSKTWNVVESNEWANLAEESGDGGIFGYRHTEEHKQRMSELYKNREVPWLIGKKHSEERKIKTSLANIGKHSETWLGRKHTEETKQKISNAHKGMKKPWAAESNKARAK